MPGWCGREGLGQEQFGPFLGRCFTRVFLAFAQANARQAHTGR